MAFWRYKQGYLGIFKVAPLLALMNLVNFYSSYSVPLSDDH